MLADKGGNPNLLRKDGHTPFSVSVMAGNLDVVKEMVARGADSEVRYNPAHKIPDPVKVHQPHTAGADNHAHRGARADRFRSWSISSRRACHWI